MIEESAEPTDMQDLIGEEPANNPPFPCNRNFVLPLAKSSCLGGRMLSPFTTVKRSGADGTVCSCCFGANALEEGCMGNFALFRLIEFVEIVMVEVHKGNGDVGRLIVCGSVPPKFGCNVTKGLLLMLLSLMLFVSSILPSTNSLLLLDKDDIVGKEEVAAAVQLEDCRKMGFIEFVATSEAISLLKIDVVLGHIPLAALPGVISVGFRLGISNDSDDNDESKSEDDDLFLTFSSSSSSSMSSLSITAACKSYGFSSPRISPKIT